MNNKVNELADKYFHYVDDLLDDALDWEIESNDENQEFILEVKKALYTDLMLRASKLLSVYIANEIVKK